MRTRPSARIVVLNQDQQVLLFRFAYSRGILSGLVYWATPGGEVEGDESFEQAASRELFEETGIKLNPGAFGEQIARRQFELTLPDGERVMADDRFFTIKVDNPLLSKVHLTELECEVMAEHKWWSIEELCSSGEKIFPTDIAQILLDIGVKAKV